MTCPIARKFEFSRPEPIHSHQAKVHCLRWNIDGTLLASCGADKTARLYTLDRSRMVNYHTLRGHEQAVDMVCWHPKNEDVLATTSLDKTVRFWDARNYSKATSTIGLKGENFCLCWSPDGTTVAAASQDELITFIDTRTNKIITEKSFKFEVNDMTWNRENDLFLVTSGGGDIHVLSYPDLITQIVLNAHSAPIISIEFDPTGRLFAVGSCDASTSIWNHEHLICTTTITRPSWSIRSVSFSHDSQYLASGSEDTNIDIADVATGDSAYDFDVQNPVLSLSFHPRHYLLAYACDEKLETDVGRINVMGFPSKQMS